MITLDIMRDASEVVHYDNPKIPLYTRHCLLSSYPGMRALCHWHEDIEVVYILNGEMNYDVNGKRQLLRQGDTIVINSRQMHYGCSVHKKECSFLCTLFHPALLMNQTYTAQRFLKPILDNSCIEYLFFAQGTPQAAETALISKEIMQLKEQGKAGFELRTTALLYQLWNIIYRTCREQELLDSQWRQPTDLLIQKKMVSYIYQNYSKTISLEDIAASGNVSRSKCCTLFKSYLQQSPVDFLNAHRLEVSCHLLKNTKESVSTIAFACGFNHLSYYSKIFFRKYGCTPSEFRSTGRPAPSPCMCNEGFLSQSS